MENRGTGPFTDAQYEAAPAGTADAVPDRAEDKAGL